MRRIGIAACCVIVAATHVGVASAQENHSGDVVINEVMWMGSAGKSSDEWIELLNKTDSSIDLSGWKIDGAGSGSNALPLSGTIPAHGYFLISHYGSSSSAISDSISVNQIASGISLSNTGEALVLKDNAGVVINDTPVTWPSGLHESGLEKSMERDGDGWHDSVLNTIEFWDEAGNNFGTPGGANSEEAAKGNGAPIAIVSGPAEGLSGEALSFSSEDSSDPDGDALTYSWNFGDGNVGAGDVATHSYAEAGIYTVMVKVSDGVLATEASQKVTITKAVYSSRIVINELWPNPAGSDTENEFIEIKNIGDEVVDLSGWQLSDSQHAFVIPKDHIINAGALTVFKYSASKISLNNDGETIDLRDPADELRSSVAYDDQGEEGWSYSRTNDGQYHWTTTVTQNEENIFNDPPAKEEAAKKTTTKKTVVAKTKSKTSSAPKKKSSPKATPQCQCACPRIAGVSDNKNIERLPSAGFSTAVFFGAALAASLFLFGTIAQEPLIPFPLIRGRKRRKHPVLTA